MCVAGEVLMFDNVYILYRTLCCKDTAVELSDKPQPYHSRFTTVHHNNHKC